jgi:SAM-dependent methyltransferase
MSIEGFLFSRSLLFSLWLTLVSVGAGAQDTLKRDHQEMHRLHRDPAAYIGALEDPKRDEYQKPHEVLSALKLRPGEVSADMIRYVNRRIRDLNVANVVSVLTDPDDPLLPERSIDRFFLCDVWHHVESPAKYLAAMKKSLKPGGEIVMIDFHKKELPFGPPLQMKIAREDLIRQMETNGFRLAKEHTFLPYQYFLVFTAR